jgi:hypothetical protein
MLERPQVRISLGDYPIRACNSKPFAPRLLVAVARKTWDLCQCPVVKEVGLRKDLLRFLHLADPFMTVVGVLSRLRRPALRRLDARPSSFTSFLKSRPCLQVAFRSPFRLNVIGQRWRHPSWLRPITSRSLPVILLSARQRLSSLHPQPASERRSP